MASPTKSQRKVAEKEQWPCWKRLFNCVVFPEIALRKGYSARNWKIGFQSRSQVLQDRAASCKNSGKKGSIAGSHAKMCTSGANSVGSEIRGKNSRRNPTCARRDAWELATEVCKLKMDSRETFCSPAEVWVISAFFSTNPEERELVIDSGASMHMLSKKDPSSGELETLRRSRNPITVVTATGEVQTNEEAQVYVHDLHLYVTVQWLEDTPAVLSLGKPWEEHGYTHEWASGQKPHLTKDCKKILLQDWELRPFGWSLGNHRVPARAPPRHRLRRVIHQIPQLREVARKLLETAARAFPHGYRTSQRTSRS